MNANAAVKTRHKFISNSTLYVALSHCKSIISSSLVKHFPISVSLVEIFLIEMLWL